jgi:capsular polysaccharide biosynthesis protein
LEQVAILDVLRRHLSTIVTLCIVAGLAGYLFSYLVIERYAASAHVLVRPQQAINLDERKLDKKSFDFSVNPSMSVETPSKTYIEIIKSRALTEKVVRSPEFGQEAGQKRCSVGFHPRVSANI